MAADRLSTLLQPHLEREAALREQLAHYQSHTERVRFELSGVEQRIQGIREAAEALQPANDAPRRSKRPTTRNRGMSHHWQRIIQAADMVHTVFTYKNLADLAAAIGHQVTNDTLRSQMSDYKGRGWVESAGLGAFKLTDAGRKAAGIAISQEKAPDVEASGAFGRVAELEGPEKTEQHPFRNGENVGSSPTPPAPRPEIQAFDADLDDDPPF